MTTLDAYTRGAAKAMRIITSSEPNCLSKAKKTTLQRDLIGEAWKSTGNALAASIQAVGSQIKKIDIPTPLEAIQNDEC